MPREVIKDITVAYISGETCTIRLYVFKEEFEESLKNSFPLVGLCEYNQGKIWINMDNVLSIKPTIIHQYA